MCVFNLIIKRSNLCDDECESRVMSRATLIKFSTMKIIIWNFYLNLSNFNESFFRKFNVKNQNSIIKQHAVAIEIFKHTHKTLHIMNVEILYIVIFNEKIQMFQNWNQFVDNALNYWNAKICNHQIKDCDFLVLWIKMFIFVFKLYNLTKYNHKKKTKFIMFSYNMINCINVFEISCWIFLFLC